MFDKAKLLAAALTLTAPLAPASAETRTYRVEANEERSFDLYLCSPSVRVTAVGDGDTDLDFWLHSPAGRMLHEDVDELDWTVADVNRSYMRGCGTYRFEVRNLGDVYNDMELSVEDAR